MLHRDISFGTSVVDLVMLTKYLAVMLEAGLAMPEALDTIVEQSSGSLKNVLVRVRKRVEGGSSLGDALALEPRTFSPVFVSAVVVGESSGTLEQNLKRLAEQMDKDLQLRRRIQSASLYPVIILSVATILGLGIATFVLPEIVSVFGTLNTELPVTTKILLWIAEVFDQYGVWISIGIIVAIFGMIVLLRQKFMRPLTHRALLSLPGIKTFTHDINRARFCRTLGTLLESGTPITEAFKITEVVLGNVVYKKSINGMRKEVAKGAALAEVLQKHPGLYPKMIVRMTAVGQESGNLGTTFSYLATFYEERVDALSKNLSSIIEPVLLIVIGLIVGLIAVSVITPIYSITSSITI